MNPFSLTFSDSELERLYRDQQSWNSRIQVRIAMLLALLAWIGFAVILTTIPYKFRFYFLVVDIIVMCPLCVILIVMSFFRSTMRLFQEVNMAANFLAAVFTITLHVLKGDSSFSISFFAAQMLTFPVFGLLVMQIPAKVSQLPTFLFFCAYLIAAIMIYQFDNVANSTVVVTSSVVYVGTVIASYRIEAAHRTTFIQTHIIEEQQRQIEMERERADNLLLNILPKDIADRLKGGARKIADFYPQVTILFADIVGFTEISRGVSPGAVVDMLDDVFQGFDELLETFAVEKIKTIGDAYMVVFGIAGNNENHAEKAIELGLQMVRSLDTHRSRTANSLQIRVGLNTGPVTAGIIGKKKFHYDMWGDTVNTASRMESHGIPGRVQVTEATMHAAGSKFGFEKRSGVEVKGKGAMDLFLVVERGRLNHQVRNRC